MAFLAGHTRRGAQQNEVVTYRHLHSSQAMTVYNPLRTIAHCDIDAAYAQFESVRLGLPDDVPLICAQWQSIIAVNYPARKYGIKRFNTIDESKRMCPHLYVQHVATYRNGESEAGYWGEVDPTSHKVSLDPYRRESLKILAIFKEMVPKGEIEKASIDEAFIDLTLMVIDRLIAIHPYLAAPPPDAPEGLDSPLPRPPPIDWTKAGNVFPVNGEELEAGAQEEAEAGEGEGHMYSSQRSDEDGDENGIANANGPGGREGGDKVDRGVTWEDWALCIGAEIMADVRAEVWKRLHYTCSAGIAHCKAMSKLCSDWKKPNNQTILRKSATPAFLRNMDFTDIRYLGGKLGNAIATEYGAKTVGDMLLVPLDEMQARFGEESIWVYNILRGIDHSEVKERTATKSMLASKNTRPAIMTPEQGMHWIGVLAGELNVRLRDAREINPGLWPKTLVLGHRTGLEAARSRQIPFPFTRNLSTEYIVKYAKRLWDEVCQPVRNGASMKLNNMSLSFTGLEKLEGGQQGIEGFFGNKPAGISTPNATSPRKSLLPGIADPGVKSGSPELDVKRPRPRSPSPLIKPHTNATASSSTTNLNPSTKRPRLPTLHAGPSRKTGLDSFLSSSSRKNGESSTPSPAPTRGNTSIPHDSNTDDEPIEVMDNDDDDAQIKIDQNDTVSWTCPKCGFRPEEHLTEEEKRGQKQEHEDFHFAQELQDAGSSPVRSTAVHAQAQGKHIQNGSGSGSGVKKKKKKEEGIKAFFAPMSSGKG